LWSETLENKSWDNERAKLENLVKRLVEEQLQPKTIHYLLSQLLANRFLRFEMRDIYEENEKQLRQQVKYLEQILSERKELLQAITKFYLEKQQIHLGNGRTLECDLGSSTFRASLLEILSRYSYELARKQFDKFDIAAILKNIKRELESDELASDYLQRLFAGFVSATESPEFDEHGMREIVGQLIGELIRKGHSPADLHYWGTALSLGIGNGKQFFKNLVSSLIATPTKWLVLTGLEDIGPPDDASVTVGNVVLHGIKYDFSPILNMIKEASLDDRVKEISTSTVNSLQGKITIQVKTEAYGPHQAGEKALQETSKVIDILSVLHPENVIREPTELQHHEMIELDVDHGMNASVESTSRLELIARKLDAKTLSNLEKMLKAFGEILVKPVDSLNEFGRRILTAVHFYRKGNFAFDPLDKVVCYFVALESMLVMKGERPSTILPKRVLDVLWVGQEWSTEMRQLVEEAYRHRGEILHYGVSNRKQSEYISASLQELSRRILAVMVDYAGKAGCDTLKQFLAMIRNDALTERERIIKNAKLEVNREYSGNGILRKSDGTSVGEVGYKFSYKDDGRYVYMAGYITKFRLLGQLSEAEGYFIEGRFTDVTGDFRLDLARSFNPLALFQLVIGRRDVLPFQVREITVV